MAGSLRAPCALARKLCTPRPRRYACCDALCAPPGEQIGFNWGAAGVSTSVWKGVLVRDILLKCGVKNPAQGANHVCFLGAEVMPKGRYA